jgi:hypothetical protein
MVNERRLGIKILLLRKIREIKVSENLLLQYLLSLCFPYSHKVYSLIHKYDTVLCAF